MSLLCSDHKAGYPTEPACLFQERLGACAAYHGIEPSRAEGLSLAFEEVFVNICRHAYPEDAGEATLTCQADAERFIIEIADSGPPFDPSSLPDPDLTGDLDARPLGGLGWFLSAAWPTSSSAAAGRAATLCAWRCTVIEGGAHDALVRPGLVPAAGAVPGDGRGGAPQGGAGASGRRKPSSPVTTWPLKKAFIASTALTLPSSPAVRAARRRTIWAMAAPILRCSG